MPNLPISGLPAAGALSSGDLTVIVQGGVTVQSTVGAFATFAGASLVLAFGLTKNNVSASDPTVNDDTTAGYAQGSRWLNTTSWGVFIAESVAAGAAVWRQLAYMETPEAYQAGAILFPYRGTQAAAGSAAQADIIQSVPFGVKQRVTLDAVAYRIATAGTVAGGNFKFAIYAMDANGQRCTGLPLAETANIASTTAAGTYVTAFTANVTLEPGRNYWLAYWDDTNAATATAIVLVGMTATELNYRRANPSVASLYFSVTAAAGAIQYNSAFGAWPNLTGVAVSSVAAAATRMPYAGLRVV